MTPSEPTDGGPGPRVYARLAHEAEERTVVLRSPRGARLAGWAIVAAIVVTVVLAALRVQPWG